MTTKIAKTKTIDENTSLESVGALIQRKGAKLNKTQLKEIETVFRNAQDFRTIGERITSPINEIITQTSQLIEQDPIMHVGEDLEKINSEVQTIYRDIINNDSAFSKGMKRLPLVGRLWTKASNSVEDMKFKMANIAGKVTIIFSGFDQSYESLNLSVESQNRFLEGIDDNIGMLVAYRDFIDLKLVDFQERYEKTEDEEEKEKLQLFIGNVEYFKNNLIILIGNLEMARKRLLVRLDSARKLSLAMNASRPIFQTLLSTALIETSNQKALDASMKAMNIMAQTIDDLGTQLTDSAIESSKKAEEMTAKPVLSTKTFIDNVNKLKRHFEEIETYRKQVKSLGNQEKISFDKAINSLNNIKFLGKKENEEFEKELLLK